MAESADLLEEKEWVSNDPEISTKDNAYSEQSKE
jgi:hypothetical protein